MKEEAVNIPLVLTLEEVNLVLSSLGEKRFIDVAGLITKVQGQAQKHFADLQAEQERNVKEVTADKSEGLAEASAS